MTWLALSYALATHSAPEESSLRAWRLIDDPTVHLGARPAAFVDPEGPSPSPVEWGVGVTVQLTTAW